MVGLAQLVRASDCGPEGRQFKSDIPPQTCVVTCECSTTVSIQVFQTWDQSSILCTRTTRARTGVFCCIKKPLAGLCFLLEEGEVGDCADSCTEDYCEDNRNNERNSALVLFSAAFNHHGWDFFFVFDGCDAASVDVFVWHFILLCEVASD